MLYKSFVFTGYQVRDHIYQQSLPELVPCQSPAAVLVQRAEQVHQPEVLQPHELHQYNDRVVVQEELFSDLLAHHVLSHQASMA